MKTQKIIWIVYVAVLTMFASNNIVSAQQWQGPNNTTSTISRTGNVGIGTTSPDAKLHIKGSDYPSSFIFLQSNLNKDAGMRFYEGTAVKYHLYNDASENALRIDGGPVSMGGNVGIGTTKPTQRLHIKESASKVHPNLRIEDSKGDGIHVGYNTTGNYGALSSNTSGKDYWDTVVWKEGRVGIGGAPAQIKYADGESFKPMLTVNGDIRVTSVPVWDGPNSYDLTWAAGYSDGLAYSPNKLLISREGSSLRYKKDLKAVDEVFSNILTVSPKKYQMRSGYGPKDFWSFGYMAEDLDKAGLKNLVIYDEKGRPDGVKYKKIAIYVNEVVKIQQKVIDQLQTDIAELKKLVNELKNSIEKNKQEMRPGGVDRLDRRK